MQGGIKLSAFNAALAARGLALSSLGSISDQTLAGALSTATHGSGVKFGNLSTFVRWLDIVLPAPDAPVVRVSRESDDELFLSALCGLGTVGVVVGVGMQVEESYRLEEECWSITFADFVERWEEIAESAEHVRCWWFPQVGEVKVSRLNRTTKVCLILLPSRNRAPLTAATPAPHATALVAVDLRHRDPDREALSRARAHPLAHLAQHPPLPRAPHVRARAPPRADPLVVHLPPFVPAPKTLDRGHQRQRIVTPPGKGRHPGHRRLESRQPVPDAHQTDVPRRRLGQDLQLRLWLVRTLPFPLIAFD